MSNLPLIDPASATGAAAELLAAVQANLGITPNMTRAMANSPVVLKSYLEFSGALAAGALRPAVREQLALAIAQSNSCGYCLSAHTYIGEHAAKLSPHEIADARRGSSDDPKVAAILRFALAVNTGHGTVSAADVDAVRNAGATNAEIAETIAHVALNVLTNYFNKAADVAIDFPVVAV
jgi:uncharacterized peroxidase-related enzyme